MEKRFSELPDWTFHVEELSAGAYKVEGRGRNDAARVSAQNLTRRRGDAEDTEKEDG